jgi:GT2 family glycosyltransferase
MGRLVSVVLVTWNSAPFLRRCLEGINQQTYHDRELIVVDNASSDSSAEMVRPQASRFIANDSNRGFAPAVNQAIAAAKGEFVLLVNPDAYLEPSYIEQIVRAFDEAGEQFGMATGKLLRGEGLNIDPTDIVDSMGIRMTRTGRHLDIGQGSPDEAPGPGPQASEIFGPSGAAAMYRMSFLRDVAIDGEIFDEDFFSFREDADIAWRGQLFGWRALYVPQAVGYHVRRVTPARRSELPPNINMHSVKNRFLLRLKNEGAYLALRNAPFELMRDLIAIAAVVTVEISSFPALVWLLKHRRRVLAKRKIIQSRRRVSDRALARWFR